MKMHSIGRIAGSRSGRGRPRPDGRPGGNPFSLTAPLSEPVGAERHPGADRLKQACPSFTPLVAAASAV
jgi:hypothetical protein